MTIELQQVSDALATTVEAVSPGIVRVEARRRLPASGLVWSRDGVIVTTHHAIERDDNIRVGSHGGQTVAATLVGRDATTDLAVLRAASAELEPPPWAESEASTLRVGHLVLALGRPGQRVQAALGVVSALGESWHTPAGGLIDRYVQTDMVMYPGFSGGPLVNMTGQVLGLNTPCYPASGDRNAARPWQDTPGIPGGEYPTGASASRPGRASRTGNGFAPDHGRVQQPC
jgi:S1-C subfamily serine protease